jgi:serine/threonine protein kinase
MEERHQDIAEGAPLDLARLLDAAIDEGARLRTGGPVQVLAFGRLLYQLATGRPPLPGATMAELPTPIARIVERCLTSDSQERWASAEDVYQELRALRLERHIAELRHSSGDAQRKLASALSAQEDLRHAVTALEGNARGLSGSVQRLQRGLDDSMQTVEAVEEQLGGQLTVVEEQLAAQQTVIAALQTTIAQTDNLLELVAESLDDEDSSPLESAPSTRARNHNGLPSGRSSGI